MLFGPVGSPLHDIMVRSRAKRAFEGSEKITCAEPGGRRKRLYLDRLGEMRIDERLYLQRLPRRQDMTAAVRLPVIILLHADSGEEGYNLFKTMSCFSWLRQDQLPNID